MEKDMEKSKIGIASNVLHMNLTIEQIQRATGLDTETISSL